MTLSGKYLVNAIWIIFFTILIAIGAFINFPVGKVPFTLQVLYVFLAGLCLGPNNAALCVVLYICLGTLGIPIFAGGTSGIKALSGATGGFLFGFIGAAYFSGFGGSYGRPQPPKKIITFSWMALGLVFLYLCGAAGLVWNLNILPSEAVHIGVTPFIPGDSIKLIFSFILWIYLLKKKLLPN